MGGRRYADGNLCGEHLGTGLRSAIARRAQRLDGDASSREEFSQLVKNAGPVGGDHFHRVRQAAAGQLA